MACSLCSEVLTRNAELVETNALMAQMLRELLDDVEVVVETVESPHPVR